MSRGTKIGLIIAGACTLVAVAVVAVTLALVTRGETYAIEVETWPEEAEVELSFNGAEPIPHTGTQVYEVETSGGEIAVSIGAEGFEGVEDVLDQDDLEPLDGEPYPFYVTLSPDSDEAAEETLDALTEEDVADLQEWVDEHGDAHFDELADQGATDEEIENLKEQYREIGVDLD